jgi:hypothetical protein
MRCDESSRLSSAVAVVLPSLVLLYSADAWPRRIYKLSFDGKVLGMLGRSGKQLKQFGRTSSGLRSS